MSSILQLQISGSSLQPDWPAVSQAQSSHRLVRERSVPILIVSTEYTVMILNWKKMSSRSPSATDEAWHWPKTGYSTLGLDSSELRVELAVQYCVFCADNRDWY